MTTSTSLPGVKHKVIGLVSGGKDSCFNLMHTVANGHEVIAIATLTPAAGIDELDSHMYQSVGTGLPPLIAKAMDSPHYSGIINGNAVEKANEYGSRERGGEGSGREGDETEDLTSLLLHVMKSHPDATAVASGAILSNYQRLRIEHVCQRLGLTSLAYLWQSEQLPLVGRMISSGLEAILVKVAGVGLGVKCVGRTLGQLFPLLTRLQAQYGAHPAGEGGEYETLTLDCPLFSHRVNITKSEVVITDPEPYPVAYMRIEDAELVEKEGWTRPTVDELRELLGLDQDEVGKEGLDEEGLEVFEEIGDINIEPGEDTPQAVTLPSEPSLAIGSKGRWFSISALGESRPGETVGDELQRCFDSIRERLSAKGLSLPLHATHVTLLLASMVDFPAANTAYITNFGSSPPSRATVAVPLPPGQAVRLEVIGYDDRSPSGPVGDRSALHVQGLSYWAPANIGPYSQAVTVDSRIHVSGQIALQPASLTFAPYPPHPRSPYIHQAALALQHARRIVEVLRSPNATGGGWVGWLESCVAWWSSPAGEGEGSNVLRQAWTAWSRRNAHRAPVLFVQAAELPRGALVEFQVNVHTGRRSEGNNTKTENDEDDDSDEDNDEDEPIPIYSSGQVRGAYYETCRAPPRRSGARAVIFLPDNSIEVFSESALASIISTAVSVRIYHLPAVIPPEIGVHSTHVPVLDIQDIQGRSYPLALEVFAA